MDNSNDKTRSCLLAGKVTRKLANLKSLIAQARNIEEDTEVLVRSIQERPINPNDYHIDTSLATNLSHLKEILADSFDIHFRELFITPLNRKAALIYLENMVDATMLETQVMEKLTMPPLTSMAFSPATDEALAYLQNTLLTAVSIVTVTEMARAIKMVLSGDTILLVEGVASLIIVASRKVESRAVTEPIAESNVRGSRDGFVEELRTNISLIRRRVKNPNLIIKKFTIGTKSDTEVALVYFRGIATPKLVCEVEQRLSKVNIDIAVDSGVIEGIMESHPYSPFPTMQTTERPDKFTSAIIEGKVGIIVDGTPFSLLAPTVFSDLFQVSDDYSEKWLFSSILRLFRYIISLFAMITPALYVAVITFHPGFIPTPLATTIASARIGVPFPAFIEALIMEIFLELLQEAGVRLPKTIGPAVSIVGGLVLGQAAVSAGLVSTPIVIVTAFTAIASFNIASYRLNLIVRFFRVPLMILAASFGTFGLMLGIIAIAIHLSVLESFGEPYVEPLIPQNIAMISDLKDTLIVAPPSSMEVRPVYLTPKDDKPQGK